MDLGCSISEKQRKCVLRTLQYFEKSARRLADEALSARIKKIYVFPSSDMTGTAS